MIAQFGIGVVVGVFLIAWALAVWARDAPLWRASGTPYARPSVRAALSTPADAFRRVGAAPTFSLVLLVLGVIALGVGLYTW